MKASEVLRNRRLEIGLSQAEVARRTGIPQSSLHYYETGKTKLNNDVAKKLCDFYQLNYKFLTGEKRIYVKKETQKNKKNDNIDNFKDTLLEKFEKIYKEEIKRLKKEALKRTYKRLKKEL